MPFNQQMNSNLVDANDTQTKRGIFRNRTHALPPQNVRSKLTSNPIPKKPNRNKFQAKVSNRKDPPTELEGKGKRSQPFAVKEVASKVVEKPSVRLFEDKLLASKERHPSIMNSCVKSQELVVNSVQSLLFRIEHCQVDTISVSKTLLSNSSSNDLDKNTITCMMPPQQPSQVDTLGKDNIYNQTAYQNEPESSFLSDTDLFRKPSLKKFNTFIKHDLDDDSYKTSKKLPSTAIKPGCIDQEISKPLPNDVTSTSSLTVTDPEIRDTDLALGHNHTDLIETELKTYHESLKKYDQPSKDVIDKFTESLNEKGKIIRTYEQELSLFNNKMCDLQRQLEESLDNTKQIESTIPKANTSTYGAENSNGLELENEKLKERIKHLEAKLAKRDLHISNLKEVLTLETNKIKELNQAQEEIKNLQRDSIEKSREIAILRDELQYAANMRQELVNVYDDKIVKLKRRLAIREYLLIKGKSTVS